MSTNRNKETSQTTQYRVNATVVSNPTALEKEKKIRRGVDTATQTASNIKTLSESSNRNLPVLTTPRARSWAAVLQQGMVERPKIKPARTQFPRRTDLPLACLESHHTLSTMLVLHRSYLGAALHVSRHLFAIFEFMQSKLKDIKKKEPSLKIAGVVLSLGANQPKAKRTLVVSLTLLLGRSAVGTSNAPMLGGVA